MSVEQLVISEWTVDTHVRHILTKLDVGSRAQVATWLIKQGLTSSRPS
jgi:DNA-binding NarL/FixJ family response regulator